MLKKSNLLEKIKRLSKKAFRDAFVRANIEQGVAHQIRILRQAKGWSQNTLARRIGASGQSAVARLEDPSYGRYTLATLLKVASALDVAVLIKFVSYGKLLAETSDLSPSALGAESFKDEYPKLLNLQVPVTPSVPSKSWWETSFSGQATIVLDDSMYSAPGLGLSVLTMIRNLEPADLVVTGAPNLTTMGTSQWLQ